MLIQVQVHKGEQVDKEPVKYAMPIVGTKP